MTYALEITFTGMCGFVPVDHAGDRAVYVLLPDTTRPDAHQLPAGHDGHEGHEGHDAGTGSGHMDLHVSRLLIDASALREGAPELMRWPVAISLQNRAIEFAGGTSELNPSLTSSLAPLRYLKSGILDNDESELIATRVVLRAGAEVQAHPGAIWKDQDGNERPMSHRLTWRIEGLEEPLRLKLKGLRGKADEDLPVLYPNPTSQTLSLYIYHVPGAELPPEPFRMEEPACDTPAHHFAALNLLVTEQVRALPLYVRGPDPAMTPDDASEFERGFAPYACMGGQITYDTGVA